MAFPKKKSVKAKSQEPEFDNTNKGVLFENTEKKKKNHPDYRGSFTDSEGNEFWVAGWQREAQSGQEYISLAFTAKEVEEEEEEEEDLPIRRKTSKKK